MKKYLFCIVLVFSATYGCCENASPKTSASEIRAIMNQDALNMYSSALSEKQDIDDYLKKVSKLGKSGSFDEAERVMKEALEKYPDNISLMNLRGLIFLKSGKKPDARTQWENVLKLNPANSFAKRCLAKLQQTPDQLVAKIPAKPVQPKTPDTHVSEIASESLSAPETNSASGTTTVASKTPDENSTEELENELIASQMTAKPAYESASQTSELSLDEQKKLAVKLYGEMSQTEESSLDDFIRMHKQVISKCPDTHWAEESCWRLSNLYLLAYSEPKFDDIIDVLEHLLKKYPSTPLMPDARNRLLNAYRSSGKHEKVVEIYAETFKTNTLIDDKTFMVWSLEYADALKALGRNREADGLYKQIIEKDNNKDSLESRVARQRLEGN
ncbi:MAG: tetratricopeptide repeat protein [Candidatus Riflebacteria bacterium]|nr:tetratricopeptide repeat protein [Candidatus Riflebacteria bacterium]